MAEVVAPLLTAVGLLLLWCQVWFTLLPDTFMVSRMNNKSATVNTEKKLFLCLQPQKFIVQFSKEFYFTEGTEG